jgi:hypothetical protein
MREPAFPQVPGSLRMMFCLIAEERNEIRSQPTPLAFVI